MIQIQYRIPKGTKPTAAQIKQWHASFIAGEAVPGVRIRAIDWRSPRSTQDELRVSLRKQWRSRVTGIIDHYAAATVTMCDYDVRTIKPMTRIWAIARMLEICPEWVEFSKTKRGWHVVIGWDREFSGLETVLLQALFGSDAFREAYNLRRLWSGADCEGRWNLLFREKIK